MTKGKKYYFKKTVGGEIIRVGNIGEGEGREKIKFKM